jgi:hypothetical protein
MRKLLITSVKRPVAGSSLTTHQIRHANILTHHTKKRQDKKMKNLTRKQVKSQRKHVLRTAQPFSETSNYFVKKDFYIQRIPHPMRAPAEGNLVLENTSWMKWDAIEGQMDLATIESEARESIDNIIESLGAEVRFSNAADKAKILAKVSRHFEMPMKSALLRDMRSKEDVVAWVLNEHRRRMIKHWHRQRYLPHNLPKNLTVELPWFYCLGDEGSPWIKPLGSVKG